MIFFSIFNKVKSWRCFEWLLIKSGQQVSVLHYITGKMNVLYIKIMHQIVQYREGHNI